jgi:plastocyanin
MPQIRTTGLRAAASVVLALLIAGCGSKSSTAPGTTGTTGTTSQDTNGGSATATSVDVTMPGERYIPNHIDIAKGGIVRFIFSAIAHDVRFNGATGAPGDILATTDATVSRTFATSGTYAFVCTLHANMTGTVVVH